MTSATTPVQNFNNAVSSLLNNVGTSFESSKKYSNLLSTIVIIILAVMIGASALSVLGLILSLGLKLPKFRFIMHLSWFLLCILMILGFLLCAVVTPISIAYLEGCEVFKEIISSQAGINSYSAVLNADIRDNLGFCLF